MVGLLARLAPARWLRAPRPTARLRLTLLYSTLFLLSGTVLLAVAYVLAAHATAITVDGPKGQSFGDIVHRPTVASRTGSAAGSHTVHLLPSQTAQLQAQVTSLHDSGMHRLLIGSGVTLIVMAVLSIVLGWLVAGRVLRPVRTINAAARRISASNLHERLSLDGPDDEFRELATTLDDLLARLQASFDSQRRFVANASHELRTPLTLDRALLERALRSPNPTEALWRATCERLVVSSQHQDHLIEALLTLARSEGTLDQNETVDLADVVDSVLLSPELETRGSGLRIQTHLNRAPITGDPRLIARLVRNLIDNAIRHNTPGGKVEITTGPKGEHTALTITNTGPIVPTPEIERLLQPFQRAGTDRIAHGEGLGLGLSIVQAIATVHKATMSAVPQTEGGLRIEVSFRRPARPTNDATLRDEPNVPIPQPQPHSPVR